MKTCAHCEKPAEGNYSIHRDGFGVGPEVPLCDHCGGYALPTCEVIWDRIAKPSPDTFAHKPTVRISGVDLGEVVRFRRWDIGQIGGAVRLLMQSPSVLRNLESTAFQLEELAKAARAAASELKTPKPEAA